MNIKDRLRSAPSPVACSPYMNVADKVYVRREDADAAADYIELLEQRVAALETYLDGSPQEQEASPMLNEWDDRVPPSPKRRPYILSLPFMAGAIGTLVVLSLIIGVVAWWLG